MILLSLCSTLATLAVLSLPFCVLQLALCKFCKLQLLRLAPAILSGAGFLWSCWYLEGHSNWDALLGFVVMLPCILGLIGSGMGFVLWRYAQKHLY